jgi:hypothetical protein
LDHHDELVLDIPTLGLHICEDSKYAAQITLAQILDVYLQLCHNDQGQDPAPLQCHLSSRVSLASQYAYLASACAEGKTFAEIAADHVDSPEFDTPESASHYAEPVDYDQPSEVYEEEKLVEEHSSSGDGSTGPNTADDAQDKVHPDESAPDSVIEREKRLPEDGLPVGDTDSTSVAQTFGQDEAYPEPPSATSELHEAGIDETALSTSHGDDPHAEDNADWEATDLQYEPQLEPLGHERFEGHEEETPSSHTVEADHIESGTAEGDRTTLAGDGEDVLDELYEHPDELYEPDESAPQPEGDFEPYTEEELFVPDEQDQDVVEELSTSAPEHHHMSPLSEPGKGDPAQQEVLDPATNQLSSDVNGSHSGPAPAVQPPPPASPPATPSKGMHTKRKVDDDDELDLLDFDTPDLKRRRPS